MKKFICTFLITTLLFIFGISASALATSTDATITDAPTSRIAATVDEEIPETGSEEFQALWGFLGGVALVAGGSSIVMYKKNK